MKTINNNPLKTIKYILLGTILGASVAVAYSTARVAPPNTTEQLALTIALQRNAALNEQISAYRQLTYDQVAGTLHRKGWSKSSTDFAALACSIAAFGRPL